MVSRRMPVIRRILCTLLVCALLTGLLPAAFAAGSDPDFSAPADKVLTAILDIEYYRYLIDYCMKGVHFENLY